jgi:hypothetical protein
VPASSAVLRRDRELLRVASPGKRADDRSTATHRSLPRRWTGTSTVGGGDWQRTRLVDFAVYGYFAPVFASQFFPSDDHPTSLVAAFGVFAVGFLMRPLGDILIGDVGGYLRPPPRAHSLDHNDGRSHDHDRVPADISIDRHMGADSPDAAPRASGVGCAWRVWRLDGLPIRASPPRTARLRYRLDNDRVLGGHSDGLRHGRQLELEIEVLQAAIAQIDGSLKNVPKD